MTTTPDDLLGAEPSHEEPTPADERTCARCLDRLEAIERVAAGHGTVSEIREAVNALENIARSGAPLGQKYKIDGLWACPRCTPAAAFGLSEDKTEPLINVIPFHHRALRRQALKNARRRRGD